MWPRGKAALGSTPLPTKGKKRLDSSRTHAPCQEGASGPQGQAGAAPGASVLPVSSPRPPSCPGPALTALWPPPCRYLYLLFSEDDALSLEDWVFNTEAHPLPVNHSDSASSTWRPR